MNKAYQTCIELIQQRGYEIDDNDDERILATRINQFTGEEEQICVFLTKTSKFNVDSIAEFISSLQKMEVSHCIIVYKDNATPVAKKIVDESKDLRIELFDESELQYNITRHEIVPKHEIAYKKGTKDCVEWKKKYSDNFPILLSNDPICRFYGYDKGDVIKVTRKNGYVTFRIVR